MGLLPSFRQFDVVRLKHHKVILTRQPSHDLSGDHFWIKGFGCSRHEYVLDILPEWHPLKKDHGLCPEPAHERFLEFLEHAPEMPRADILQDYGIYQVAIWGTHPYRLNRLMLLRHNMHIIRDYCPCDDMGSAMFQNAYERACEDARILNDSGLTPEQIEQAYMALGKPTPQKSNNMSRPELFQSFVNRIYSPLDPLERNGTLRGEWDRTLLGEWKK